MNNFRKFFCLTVSVLGLVFAANAAPVLRDNITVISPIVTVGDMFEDAGIFSEHALFRAPAPGTIGQVSVQSIRIASAKVGMDTFENPGFFNVSVARKGVNVDLTFLEHLISNDLTSQGILRQGMSVSAFLTRELAPLFAEDNGDPVSLINLRYAPNSGRFSARFSLAGTAQPLNISGRLDFSILAPHLVRALPNGTILTINDIELRKTSLQFARNVGVPTLDQLVGLQLRRNQLEGASLRLNDVIAPVLIARNDIVTLYLKAGAMTLTVKGQALENAAQGANISVLNLMSNTVVHGIAAGPNSVQISAISSNAASL